MFKLKVTPLNLTVAVVLGLLVEKYEFLDGPNVSMSGQVLTISDGVNDKSMEKAVHLLKKTDSNVVLDVKSPGGSVMAGRDLLTVMRSKGGKVDTYADNYFMSMGMSIFLEGKNRYVKHDTIGMIHRGSAGEVSYGKLKEMAKVTNSEELKDQIEIMDKLFEREFERLEDIKKTSSNPDAVQKLIDVLKEGNTDVFLNAEELLALGIATEIVPDSVSPEDLVK